jgi:hypothetical protein
MYTGSITVYVEQEDSVPVLMNMSCRISADKLRTAFSEQDGIRAGSSGDYWHPIVIEGEGRMGRLCGGDRVMFVKASREIVALIAEPHTSEKPWPPLSLVSAVSVPGEKDWLGKLRKKETFALWDQLRDQIEHDKMIHVVTDGGARPNPGKPGRGALLRKNNKVTWF